MNQTKPTLIFDMDGVILDTEQLVRRCWNEIAPEFHANAIDAVFLTTVGTTRVHTCNFDYVLGGDRIARSKPAPDIYETACRALHAVPADTYAIEDSYNGIRAAHAAGMRPIMVPDLLPPTQEMHTLAAHIFPNLTAFHEFLKR